MRISIPTKVAPNIVNKADLDKAVARATTAERALNAMKDEQAKATSLKSREDLLKQQFAQARLRMGGQRTEAQRQSDIGLNRLQAMAGTTGGAVEKARMLQQKELGRTFAEAEGELGGQEAAQVGALREAEATRQTQQKQFEQTLKFQKDSFAEQMKYAWAEMDENKKTNYVNAAIALREAGLQTADDWARLAASKTGILPALYGGPTSKGGVIVGGGSFPTKFKGWTF